MCAASRALWSVAFLGAGCLLASVAEAQAPAIPATPAAVPSGQPAPPVPAAPSPEPTGSAPPFTPPPELPFTAAAPAAPAPSATPDVPVTPPGYVAPAYASPLAANTALAPAAPAPAAPAPAPAPSALPKSEAAKSPHAEDARWNDAHLDRVVFVPTAETHPAGTTYLSSYEIIGLQAGHALSDRTQLTVSFLPIVFGKDPIVPLDLTLKGVIVRKRRVHVAAMASASGLFGFDSGAAALGRVGGAAQFCFDDGCSSSVSMGLSMVFAGNLFLVADGVGAIVRVARNMAFLAELQTVVPVARDGGATHALGGAVGLRFAGKRAAIDVALEAPLDRRTKPQAIPVLIATYRFLP